MPNAPSQRYAVAGAQRRMPMCWCFEEWTERADTCQALQRFNPL